MNWDKRFKTCCDLTKYNHYRKYYFYIPLSWAFPWKIALNNKRFNIISINATTQALSAWVSLRSNSSVHSFLPQNTRLSNLAIHIFTRRRRRYPSLLKILRGYATLPPPPPLPHYHLFAPPASRNVFFSPRDPLLGRAEPHVRINPLILIGSFFVFDLFRGNRSFELWLKSLNDQCFSFFSPSACSTTNLI